jgi:APA family basic amino acid/polyamine antiporter
VVDYAEATCGKTYAYFVGWFASVIYFPAMTSVLAWVSARYTMVAVFGYNSLNPEALFSNRCIIIAAFYLIVMYFINAVAPRLSGKLQVSTTVIKLVPIVFIALVGTIIGLFNGTLGANLEFTNALGEASGGNGMFAAVCCTAFAYEGWIIATTINSEIKDSKRNLPIALLFGSVIVVVAYVLYYVGVCGLGDVATLMSDGTTAAFEYFGTAVATVINFIIIVSCLGTLNGLTLGCSRGIYALAARGEGISPKTLSQIDRQTNMPSNSASFGLLLCTVWFVYFIGVQFLGWFGDYVFDSSELPIITLYPLYIPMLIMFMIKEKNLNPFLRVVLPSLSVVGSGIMIAASIFRHGISIVWYLIVFAAIMLIGAAVYLYNKKAKA